MGRIFERLQKVCGGSNLSTDLLLWGLYIKKCISLVRIRLQTENARNASTTFRFLASQSRRRRVYHQHEVLYIIRNLLRYIIKPQVDARWRVMRYKGGNAALDDIHRTLCGDDIPSLRLG